MFDTFFQHKYVNRKEVDGMTVHLYRFQAGRHQTIMVEVQQFKSHPISVVKFFDKDDRNSPDRYTRLTGKGNFNPILRTCINIMIEIKDQNPFMSFAFLGAQNPEEKQAEIHHTTQRYKLYEYGMEQFFLHAHFQHTVLEAHSLYMLFNRDYCDTKPEIQTEILRCVQEVYPDEPLWEGLF